MNEKTTYPKLDTATNCQFIKFEIRDSKTKAEDKHLRLTFRNVDTNEFFSLNLPNYIHSNPLAVEACRGKATYLIQALGVEPSEGIEQGLESARKKYCLVTVTENDQGYTAFKRFDKATTYSN